MDKSSLSAQTCPKCFFLNPADAAHCGRCGAELGRSADKGFLPEQVIGGRYRLVRRIGEGGMGEVWEAVQTGVNLSVAIKFLHPVLMIHNTARQRVLKEAEALGRLRRSSRIITLYDYFETDETVALVQDSLKAQSCRPHRHGGTIRGVNCLLDGRCAQRPRRNPSRRLIHRDMKPDNYSWVGTRWGPRAQGHGPSTPIIKKAPGSPEMAANWALNMWRRSVSSSRTEYPERPLRLWRVVL